MSGAAVSADVRALLRAAFANELEERLPRLTAGTDPEVVRRDAHTLASSAAVVGEPEIARAARAVELGAPTSELVLLLQQWVP